MATPAISTTQVFTHEATFRKDPFDVLHIRHDGHGNVEINLEDAARGLGFTYMKNGVEYVRWERVKQYLKEFGYTGEVNKDAYIPESTFFKLTMKAGSKTAKKFQRWIADEVIPNLHKRGGNAPSTASVTSELDTNYLLLFAIEVDELRTKSVELAKTIDAQARLIKETRAKNKELEATVDAQAQQIKKYEELVEPLVTLSNAIAAYKPKGAK